jgi:formylglycine-generating enzyme required for sulfatase activity
VLVGLLQKRGVGEATVLHQLGIIELAGGKLRAAAARIEQAATTASTPAHRHAHAGLSMLSGRAAGVPVWRSLPRGFVVNLKYRIEEEIGRGGMASVYRAVLIEPFEQNAVVAIKVPAPPLVSDPAARLRFQKEIDRSRRLVHPNIVRVLDYEIFDEPYTRRRTYGLVMEYVPGHSLARLLALHRSENRPLRLDTIRNVMEAVCAALEYAHTRHHLLHRDVKPHNILVSGNTIKLMDFGIARELNDSQDRLTRTGQVLGTLAYVPPEMIHPDPSNPAGVAADVYMVGVLLKELLTFHPSGKLSERGDCPPRWRALVSAALSHDPGERPQSIAAFRERLFDRPWLPVSATSGQSANLTGRSPSRRGTERPGKITNSLGMRFVLVLAGKFLMGSSREDQQASIQAGLDESCIRSEGPQHEVEITRAFYLGVHPVTQAEWRAVMGSNPSWFCATGGGKDRVKGRSTDDFPVESVNWDDVAGFLAKLSALKEERQAGREYRLPTEAEWEYACRGGLPPISIACGDSLSSAQGNFDGRYPFGRAETGPYLERPCKVCSYKPNGFGLYDMQGNVFEWCADWYDAGYYRRSPEYDPPGPAEGAERVIRGGGWCSDGWSCRPAARAWSAPGYRNYVVGLRVALVLSPERHPG